MGLLRGGLGPFVAREVGPAGQPLATGKVREETVRRVASAPNLVDTPVEDRGANGLLRWSCPVFVDT